MESIYLDYNSTTPMDPTVVQAMTESQLSGFVNPSSQHRLGQNARQLLEDEKCRIIELLGGKSSGLEQDRLVITSGGTESNNLALSGVANFQNQKFQRNELIVSSIEHPSVLETANYLQASGMIVHHLPVDSTGKVNVDFLPQLISPNTALVSVMLANHETGVIQPIPLIGEICREHNVLLHCDATQAIGKIPVHFGNLGVDLMTISPHKFYGPRQIGALLVRRNIDLAPILYGGQQQLGTRPGTEDVPSIVGARVALELAIKRLAETDAIKKLRDELESHLSDHLPDLVINGIQGERLPNTSNISVPGANRQALLMSADLHGIALSTGSACASGSSEPSPVLTAMNLPNSIIDSAIRISLGFATTKQDIEFVGQKLGEIINKLRSSKQI